MGEEKMDVARILRERDAIMRVIDDHKTKIETLEESLQRLDTQLPRIYYIVAGDGAPEQYKYGDIVFSGSESECVKFIDECNWLGWKYPERKKGQAGNSQLAGSGGKWEGGEDVPGFFRYAMPIDTIYPKSISENDS